MNATIIEEPVNRIAELAQIPIAFRVDRIFDVITSGGRADRPRLVERTLAASYLKDYDAIPGENPSGWAQRFDLTNWAFLGANVGGQRVAGAVMAFDTQEVDLLEGRKDLAVLWDIRVSPTRRRSGLGRALFQAVEALAKRRKCRQLKVETQNINVPACRFYARCGCALSEVNRGAYREFPDEIQLVWRKELGAGLPAAGS